jgi:hypothetical protein
VLVLEFYVLARVSGGQSAGSGRLGVFVAGEARSLWGAMTRTGARSTCGFVSLLIRFIRVVDLRMAVFESHFAVARLASQSSTTRN